MLAPTSKCVLARFLAASLAVLLAACSPGNTRSAASREQLAIEFLEGVYGGDPTVVERLAAPDIVVSYPIFAELFGTPALEGREAIRNFAIRFGERWLDPAVSVHSVVANEDAVVVLWGFRATPASADTEGARALPEQGWGGITLYRFDSDDKVVLEIGEESDPGPAARVPAAFGQP